MITSMKHYRGYLESIGNQSASLSLSNISRFYVDYVTANQDKVVSELNRVGYFTLKNKLSIGENKLTTKDIFISTYFVNMSMHDEFGRVLYQKYHGDIDVSAVNGFFVSSTNELVVIIRVGDGDEYSRTSMVSPEDLKEAIRKADVRSTIEHELVHAFDHTHKSARLAKQKPSPGVGNDFVSACAYLGCIDRADMLNILASGLFSGKDVSECIFAISIILYRLFTITEFNAHQMSGLEETHGVDIRRSEEVKKALKRDILSDTTLNKDFLEKAVSVDANENPALWRLVGNVLSYMGYNLKNKSPSAVYNFFVKTSNKLFRKFFQKKLKNQSKAIISLREKNNIKTMIKDFIERGNLSSGVSFWFTPSGYSDSYLCRIIYNSNVILTINHNPVKIYGNADGAMKRALDSLRDGDESKFDFSVDILVDIIVQSIERNFNHVLHDPVYDITDPQDEIQISKSSKVANRFTDLDWD